MKVQLVRLSRPLLLAADRYMDGNSYYQAVYGFLVQEKAKPADPVRLNQYVGYLAGLHCISNGDNYFSISFEERGVPDWKDKKGVIHTKHDAWMTRMQQQCMKKLNLSYTIINADIDEDDLDKVLNEEGLIVDEEFYYDLKRGQAEKGPLCPVVEDDELPF